VSTFLRSLFSISNSAEGGAHTDNLKREKLMKLDARRREYNIVVIGEEAHLAYNRVGLTSFFQHRKVENLYLNPKEWVSISFSLTQVTPNN